MPKKPIKNDDYDRPFEIPQQFWNQLDSMTCGGWICFYIDQYGDIVPAANFENAVSEEAIRAFGARFLNSLNASREIQETENFLMDGHEDCDRYDEDDED